MKLGNSCALPAMWQHAAVAMNESVSQYEVELAEDDDGCRDNALFEVRLLPKFHD